jgi:hypothetical protein
LLTVAVILIDVHNTVPIFGYDVSVDVFAAFLLGLVPFFVAQVVQLRRLSETERTEHRKSLQGWAKDLQGGQLAKWPPPPNELDRHQALVEHSEEIGVKFAALERTSKAAGDAWRIVVDEIQQDGFSSPGKGWLENQADCFVKSGNGCVDIEEWQWPPSPGVLISSGGEIYRLESGEDEAVLEEKRLAFMAAIRSMGDRPSVHKARETRLLAKSAEAELIQQLAKFINKPKIVGGCHQCRPKRRTK